MKAAKLVFHQGASTSISKTVGELLHKPSELDALTLKLYVPGGMLV